MHWRKLRAKRKRID